MKVKHESKVAQSCLTLSDPWTAAYQAPPSMGLSRPEYWSGVPLPSPKNALDTDYSKKNKLCYQRKKKKKIQRKKSLGI